MGFKKKKPICMELQARKTSMKGKESFLNDTFETIAHLFWAFVFGASEVCEME